MLERVLAVTTIHTSVSRLTYSAEIAILANSEHRVVGVV